MVASSRMVKCSQLCGELFSAAPAGHMAPTVKMRLGWVQHYEKTGNASLTSRRCGISRPTLRKWVGRYQAEGLEGLLDQSHRPKRCPPKKINAQHLLWIGQLRKRRLGARRIQSELLRLHQVSFSTATIHKVLKQEGYGLLKATRRPRKGRKRYQKKGCAWRAGADGRMQDWPEALSIYGH